jgi:hypothetical protein
VSENLPQELPSEKPIKKTLLPQKSENLQSVNKKTKKNSLFILAGGLIGIIALCCIIMLAITILFQPSSGIAIPQSTPTYMISLPEYTLFKDKSYEDAGTFKVIWEILVSPDISKESLSYLLNELYRKALAEASGINDRPVVIDIKAYTSEEHATSGAAQWIGWIVKNGVDSQPTISFYEELFNTQNQTQGIKFGLTEAERKQTWQDIVRAEVRAEEEALQQYPNMQPFDEFKKLEDEISLRNKSELAQEKGLSLEQLEEIRIEGLTKNWPFPSR